MDNITNRRVAQKLAEFEKAQDPTLLHETLELIEAAERAVPTGGRAEGREVLARRLRFLAALDRTIDPSWDLKKQPIKGAPLPSSHGVVYPSGEVDPSTIPDPVERAAYERALKASKDYEKWYDVQFQLRQIDERAMRFVERFVAERFARSPADMRVLEELLAESSVSAERKERLRNVVPDE